MKLIQCYIPHYTVFSRRQLLLTLDNNALAQVDFPILIQRLFTMFGVVHLHLYSKFAQTISYKVLVRNDFCSSDDIIFDLSITFFINRIKLVY